MVTLQCECLQFAVIYRHAAASYGNLEVLKLLVSRGGSRLGKLGVKE